MRLASIALVLAAAPAQASPAAALREGERAMESLDYNRAIAAFERAAGDSEASAPELVTAYTALVRCHVVLGNEASARLAAEQLLGIDPEAEITGAGVPPRVTRFFEDFKRTFQGATEVALSVYLPERIRAGETLQVVARITRGRRAVAGLRMHARFGADPTWVPVDLRQGERTWSGAVEVPAAFRPATQSLRYWVEALSASGATIGGLGSEDEPMAVAPAGSPAPVREPVERRPPEPAGSGDPDAIQRNEEYFRARQAITSKWWFWTGIAAVVAGGTIAAIAISNDEGEPARHGADGDWPLP